jgi:uncharacterized protein
VDYGNFLNGVFDEWLRGDVGNVFVQTFDVQLALRMGLPSSLCVYSETCGRALALEHNGDVYACDHYVYPEHLLGNLHDLPLREIVDGTRQREFAQAKADDLPAQCRACPWLRQCWGECPKHRFAEAPDGAPGLNYLCAGLRQFFGHSAPAFDAMAAAIRSGRPAASALQPTPRDSRPGSRNRIRVNDPCPCGSGRKFKRCHGRTR